ncbi:MAG: PASTA domain-containing protein, partial [Gemmatimonadetes bacterium]|nr:PASTA domain-containing protein [Gemmatimonadota bacterium]
MAAVHDPRDDGGAGPERWGTGRRPRRAGGCGPRTDGGGELGVGCRRSRPAPGHAAAHRAGGDHHLGWCAVSRGGGGQWTAGRIRIRRRLLLVAWVLVAVVMVVRSAEVQIVERTAWARDAVNQHQKTRDVPAPRGRILDRNGGDLVVSHWRATVAVAPNEVGDRGAVEAALVDELGVRPQTAARVSDPTREWSVVPGRYSMTQVAGLRGLRGIHIQGELRRVYPREELARGLLGVVQDGIGTGGIEQAMDTVLAGRSGSDLVARDNRGREIPGQVVTVEPPLPGRDIVLTIDRDLQEIAEEMLAAALDSTGARGGDIVVTDPMTGEIMALASIAEGSAAALSAVNTTFEPGSTIKPFITTALLRHDLVSPRDSVDTEGGRWEVNGRVITDIHRGGWMTLPDVIRESSNVGIAKFASRLSEGQQYVALRDFGFGTPTGVPLPGEAAGVLRRPELWSNQSPQSLAIGYELSVTPLQMAMAFGAIANGGLLLEPRLVKEVRDHDGSPERFGQPRVIRRVVPESVIRTLTPMLVDVVDSGTATRARMAAYQMAGKTATTRATGSDGRYEDGAYYASFGAIFPADDPQLLFFVRLDRPDGSYYGGATAAPVTLATLEALLSARQSPIDRVALARSQREHVAPAAATPLVRFAVATDPVEPEMWVPDPGDAGAAGPAEAPSGTGPAMSVPDLEGASLRVALRRLHKMGLRVRLEGGGTVIATIPEEGMPVVAGDTIVVVG